MKPSSFAVLGAIALCTCFFSCEKETPQPASDPVARSGQSSLLSGNASVTANLGDRFPGGELCPGAGTTLFYEDFSNYQPGPISPQSPYWYKWSESTSWDGMVLDVKGGKFMAVERSSGSHPGTLLRLGRQTSGRYWLSFRLAVPYGYSGAVTIQKTVSRGNLSNETGAQLVFGNNYNNFVKVAGQIIPLPALKPVIYDFHLDVNLDANRTTLYLGDIELASWSCRATTTGASGSLSFEGLRFHSYSGATSIYLYNVCWVAL